MEFGSNSGKILKFLPIQYILEILNQPNFSHIWHFSVTGESPPSLSKELTNSLAGVGDVSFDADSQFPLDELKIDPLTLDGLHMLNDPDMVLTDPATEDTFRMDRLWANWPTAFWIKEETIALTCWWGGIKGRMNPLSRCMAVQSYPQLCEALWKLRDLEGKEEKDVSGLQRNDPAIVLNKTGRSALLLAYCVYSVPSRPTYIPKMHIWQLIYFAHFPVISTIYLYLPVAGSYKDTGLTLLL